MRNLAEQQPEVVTSTAEPEVTTSMAVRSLLELTALEDTTAPSKIRLVSKEHEALPELTVRKHGEEMNWEKASSKGRQPAKSTEESQV